MSTIPGATGPSETPPPVTNSGTRAAAAGSASPRPQPTHPVLRAAGTEQPASAADSTFALSGTASTPAKMSMDEIRNKLIERWNLSPAMIDEIVDARSEDAHETLLQLYEDYKFFVERGQGPLARDAAKTGGVQALTGLRKLLENLGPPDPHLWLTEDRKRIEIQRNRVSYLLTSGYTYEQMIALAAQYYEGGITALHDVHRAISAAVDPEVLPNYTQRLGQIASGPLGRQKLEAIGRAIEGNSIDDILDLIVRNQALKGEQ